MKRMEKIKVSMNALPIFHSEYLNWVLSLSSLNDKRRAKYEKFYNAILKICDEDWVFEFISIEIDGCHLTPELLKDYDLDDAICKLSGISFGDLNDGEYIFNPQARKSLSDEDQIKGQVALLLRRVQALMNQDEDEQFYYNSLPVSKEILMESISEGAYSHYRIRPELSYYLRFFDLSGIDFMDVDIRGHDLSYTNAKISPELVHMRSCRNTNLTGVNLGFNTIKGVDFRGARLEGTFAVIDASSCLIEDAITDDTCTIFNSNGVLPKEGKTIELLSNLHF